jgi:predicted GNAT family acetyltransferase
MKVRHVPQIGGSDVLPYVHMAWGALMRDGLWSKTEMLINGAEECAYATVGRDTVIACIVYRTDESKQAVIAIAYVSPKHRGKGVYKKLHAEFEARVKSKGATVVVNICYPTNLGIQETCKKPGYSLHSVEYRKPL